MVLERQVQPHRYPGPAPQSNNEVQELSDYSDVEENRGGRNNWSEDGNKKLVSAWLHNSTNSEIPLLLVSTKTIFETLEDKFVEQSNAHYQRLESDVRTIGVITVTEEESAVT